MKRKTVNRNHLRKSLNFRL